MLVSARNDRWGETAGEGREVGRKACPRGGTGRRAWEGCRPKPKAAMVPAEAAAEAVEVFCVIPCSVAKEEMGRWCSLLGKARLEYQTSRVLEGGRAGGREGGREGVVKEEPELHTSCKGRR